MVAEMQLTQEQFDAVKRGVSLRLTEAGTEVVIVRADLFERLNAPRHDDDPWTDDEMDMLAAEDADGLGWEGMEAYQDVQE
jgi:hypothetical protein